MPHRQRTTPSFTVEIKRASRKRTPESDPPGFAPEEGDSLLNAVFGGSRASASPGAVFAEAAGPASAADSLGNRVGVPGPRLPRVLPDLRAASRENGPGQAPSSVPNNARETELDRSGEDPDGPADTDRLGEDAADPAPAATELRPEATPSAAERDGALRAKKRRAKRTAARKAKRLGLTELPLPAGQRWRRRRLPPSCW
jgi:hypothetical protein